MAWSSWWRFAAVKEWKLDSTAVDEFWSENARMTGSHSGSFRLKPVAGSTYLIWEGDALAAPEVSWTRTGSSAGKRFRETGKLLPRKPILKAQMVIQADDKSYDVSTPASFIRITGAGDNRTDQFGSMQGSAKLRLTKATLDQWSCPVSVDSFRS